MEPQDAQLSPIAEPDLSTMKRCRICGRLKPLDMFPKHSGYKGGWDTRCKQCVREYKAPYRPVTEKRCPQCGLVKPASAFGPHTKNSDRLASYCRERENQRSNKKKLARRNERKKQCIQLMGGECQRCGYKESLAAMTFHHVSRGEKEMSPATLMGPAFSREEVYMELDECILLCSNCHAGYSAREWTAEFVRRGEQLLGHTLHKTPAKRAKSKNRK